MDASMTAPKGPGKCDKFTQKALVLDIYGRPFQFMLPNSKQKYKSIVGSICTIFVMTMVLIYAVYKFENLVAKDESRVQISIENSYFNETEIFSSKRGFNMAFGLSSYSDTSSYFDGPEYHKYGRVRLLMHTRDSTKDGQNTIEEI